MATLSPIALSIPDLRGNEKEYLTRCVTDNWVSSAGPFVTEFEARVSALTGRRHAVSTVNGTTALQLALVTAGVNPGDFVIVPDWTFAATANAVVHAGATPIFVDITEVSLTIDPTLVLEALKGADKGMRISAIVPVHAAGHPPDMDPILEAAASFGIPVVEDAAGAIGGSYKGRPAGSLGDAAIFSFNGNKMITAGGGGIVLTDRDDWAERARHLSTQARIGNDYEHDAIGANLRMTNLNAAVGVAQLERLGEMLAARKRIAARYDAAIENRNDLSPLPKADWAMGNCWLYTILANDENDARDLISHLTAQKIGARGFWRSLSAQRPYAAMPRLLSGVAKSVCGRTISLPCSSNLTEEEQTRVIDAINSWSGSGSCPK